MNRGVTIPSVTSSMPALQRRLQQHLDRSETPRRPGGRGNGGSGLHATSQLAHPPRPIAVAAPTALASASVASGVLQRVKPSAIAAAKLSPQPTVSFTGTCRGRIESRSCSVLLPVTREELSIAVSLPHGDLERPPGTPPQTGRARLQARAVLSLKHHEEVASRRDLLALWITEPLKLCSTADWASKWQGVLVSVNQFRNLVRPPQTHPQRVDVDGGGGAAGAQQRALGPQLDDGPGGDGGGAAQHPGARGRRIRLARNCLRLLLHKSLFSTVLILVVRCTF